MNLVDLAKKDIEAINSDKVNGWAVDLKFTNPTASLVVTIQGRSVKHHTSYDDEGNKINTRIASVSFSEKAMIDVGYSIRNTAGEVSMKKHLVEVKDSTGTLVKYRIEQWFPDETIGMVVCILGSYEQ